jgi:hypothetical protein
MSTRRVPHLVVGRAARVEADDQARLADAVGERIDVVGQVVAAALLAALDQDHAAGVRDALLGEGADGGQRGEQAVAVVGAAAPVELVAADHRLPRAELRLPAGHRRLLVEVPVEHDGVVAGARHLQVQQRGAPLQPVSLDHQAGQLLGPRPGLEQVGGPVHVTVLGPLGVELRRLVRDLDVLHQGRRDALVPGPVHEAADALDVHDPESVPRFDLGAKPPYTVATVAGPARPKGA